jgi:hypothetical protein
LKSKKYIVAWDGAIDNVLDISNQLAQSDIPHIFYNVSSIPNQNDNWVMAEDVRYYGHFFNALTDFMNNTKHEIFIFNAGDVQSDRHVEYVKYIEKVFGETPNIGLFAPETSRDTFNGESSYIRKSTKYDNLYLSTNTNGIYVAMTRELASHMYLFYLWAKENPQLINFRKMVSGWGLDMCYCSLAIILNKGIYRDSTANMIHPESQSYTDQAGSVDYEQTTTAFKVFCEKILSISSLQVAKIIHLTIKQVKETGRFKNKVEDLYSNPGSVRSM